MEFIFVRLVVCFRIVEQNRLLVKVRHLRECEPIQNIVERPVVGQAYLGENLPQVYFIFPFATARR